MNTRLTLSLALLLVGTGILVPAVRGQSLSLDDNPRAPLFSPAGLGVGAEDEFGLVGGPGLAPSPSLGLLGFPSDGTIFTPGIPTIMEFTPDGNEIDAFSTNHFRGNNADLPPVTLHFSVDRLTTGAPGTAVAAEFAVGQQPGDIYSSTAMFPHPAKFAGVLGPGPFAGVLPSAGGGGGNVLSIDESAFGLTTAAGIVPPGVPAGPIGMGTHDNLDAFDFTPQVPVPGGVPGAGVYPMFSYFAISPDEAIRVGTSAADIYDVAPSGGRYVPSALRSVARLGTGFGRYQYRFGRRADRVRRRGGTWWAKLGRSRGGSGARLCVVQPGPRLCLVDNVWTVGGRRVLH